MRPKLKLLETEIRFIDEYIKNPENKRKKTKLPDVFQKKFGKKHGYKKLISFLKNSQIISKVKINKTRREINRSNYHRNKTIIKIKQKYKRFQKRQLVQEFIFDKNVRLFKATEKLQFNQNYAKPNVNSIIRRLRLQNKKTKIELTIKKAVAINKVN